MILLVPTTGMLVISKESEQFCFPTMQQDDVAALQRGLTGCDTHSKPHPKGLGPEDTRVGKEGICKWVMA